MKVYKIKVQAHILYLLMNGLNMLSQFGNKTKLFLTNLTIGVFLLVISCFFNSFKVCFACLAFKMSFLVFLKSFRVCKNFATFITLRSSVRLLSMLCFKMPFQISFLRIAISTNRTREFRANP